MGSTALANPVFQKFFAGKGLICSKFAEQPEHYLFKKQLMAEKYLAGTQVASTPFFEAKGRYLIMHNISFQSQAAIHESCYHAISTERSKRLMKSVAPTFNRLIGVALGAK